MFPLSTLPSGACTLAIPTVIASKPAYTATFLIIPVVILVHAPRRFDVTTQTGTRTNLIIKTITKKKKKNNAFEASFCAFHLTCC